ncbi:phage tail tape measure protein [Algoriphagus halophytocola]|uniref:phage tail tape measure protein n=1 Tax=Algoriphagus halophytocola TaxID=2991499 RepID=UPI0022DD0C85|nr:phage tail tape measure protein [Algoriphagus sp. TR-M9]WBL42407.1 phage tail tape measure protein [Algoriphagus sp. TR-M9]WBL43082.1 phage tail tape measure protein [Algoriphagus sp. TR-M9]
MIRQDTVQMRMEIDGKQSISELGKQEMAAYEYRSELKQIKEEQVALERESKKVDKIRERYDRLTKQVKELEAAGKTTGKAYIKTATQLGKVSEQLRSAEKATKDLASSQARYKATADKLDETNLKIKSLRKEMGLAGMTMSQLRSHQRDLQREMDKGITKGTERYERLKREIQEVNGAIRAQRADVNGTTSAWSKIKTEITRFGVLALGYLGAQELLGRIGNLVRGAAELSDALSDVRKTTDLTDASVKELNKDLGDLNTRTARKELLGMAEIAGRLGIKGKADILGFVNAADQINVALGDSLGETETVMRELGKLTSTYKIQEAYGIEESLLRVGSAINELGMASTANEGNIVDFTRRMGGIAPLAKISVQEILGMGATLDSLGQTSETSSTALSKLFINMAKNAKEYARFAKMEMADFVNLMNTDANEAFIRVLEGIQDNSAGITELAGTLGDLGEDGGRVVGVLGTLANNTKLLREQQALSNRSFQEGTSITEEFQVKNENLAASLAKVQRWINQAFINSTFMNFLEKSIGKLADWAMGIDEATRAFQGQEKYVQSLERKLPDLINRYDELDTYAVRNTEQQEEMAKIIEEIARLVPTAVTEFDEYGKAIGISTGKVREFTKAQKEALKLQNADAIAEQRDHLKLLENDILRISWALQRRDDEGDLFKYVTSQSGLAQQKVKLTADEIRNLQKELNSLNDQKLGRMQILADLGDDEAVSQFAFQGAPASLGRAGFFQSDPIADSESSASSSSAEQEIDKMLEKFKDFQQTVKDLNAEAELDRLEKDSREIAQIEQKFQTLREKALEYYNQGYLDKQTYDQTVAQLDSLQNEYQDRAIDEQNEAVKEKRAKFQEDIALMAMDEQEQEIEQTQRKFDALIAQAQEYGLDTAELERLRRETIEEINKEFDERLLKQKQQTNDRQLRADMEMRQAQIEVTMEYARIAGEAINLVGKKGGELTAFQKILALAQIGIDTGAAIMKAELVALQAASAGGPAAPFIYKATKLSIIGSILAAAGRAKNLFSNSEVPEFGQSEGEGNTPVRGRSTGAPKNSYYFGGATGGGLGFGDQYGEYAGYVHRHEYVIPEAVRKEPIVQMQIEPLLESLRMRAFSGRSFYNGGETSPTASPTAAVNPVPGVDNSGLIKALNRLNHNLENPLPSEAYLVYSKDEAFRKEAKDLEKRYKA